MSDEKVEDALLNLEEKSNEEVRRLLDGLYEEEKKVSYRRRVLHGKIDILRAELVRRLKAQHESGSDVISGHDVEKLISILSNESRPVHEDIPIDIAEDEDDH